MKFFPQILFAALLLPAIMRADDHLGPSVYLAALQETGGKTVLHWKYNIAKPGFGKVRVLDAKGQEVAEVKRPIREVAVAGHHGPFRLIPLQADGSTGTEVVIPEEPPLPPVPAISRIGIQQRDGSAEFVELSTGKIFHPVGMNYIPLRNGDHATFEAPTKAGEGFYDPLEAETVLQLLRKNGYNAVRVFLAGRKPKNPGLSGEEETKGLYTPYLDNLADFLRRAAANGIHVIFNFCDADLPTNRYFRKGLDTQEGGENFFRSQGVLAYREMVASTVGYLKEKNSDLLKAVLGVQFNNEVCTQLTRWPFSETGPVTTANGKTYDMGVPDERLRCYSEGLEYFYRQVCGAVKSVDSGLLTCEGMFVAAAVGRDHREGAAAFDTAHLATGFDWEKANGMRIPPPLTLLARSPLDFVDVHLYPSGKLANFDGEVEALLGSSLFQEATAQGLCSVKPVILGEFGAFKAHVEKDTGDSMEGAMKRWDAVRRIACEKYGFTGYLGWSLETFEQTDIFQALAFGPGFLKKFREDFPMSSTDSGKAPDHAAASKNPLILREIPPTGPAKGFLVPQKLIP